MSSQFSLFKTRRFVPLFLVQILGAFNDNIFKNALIILLTYRAADVSNLDNSLLVTIAGGLFIMPFFLFSSIAGEIADKCEKSGLVRKIKLAEILIMTAGSAAFYTGELWFLMAVLFLMGTQSTFFGPLKYGLLPEHLEEHELIGGNALFDAATFLAILAGTIAGSLLILRDNGELAVSIAILVVAFMGWLASLKVPMAEPGDPSIKVSFNIAKASWKIVRYTTQSRPVFLSIQAISWFWFIGATMLVLLPVMVSDIIQGNEKIITLFLSAFSIGIGVGSLLCNSLLKGEVSGKFAALSILIMCGFLFDLSVALSGFSAISGETSLSGFFDIGGTRILADFTGIAVAAGIFVVPLYAVLQERGEKSHHARIIASLNICNSFAMVLSSIALAGLFAIGVDIPTIILAVGILNLLAVWLVSRQVDDCILKNLFLRHQAKNNQ